MKITGVPDIKATLKKCTLTLPNRDPELKLIIAGLPYGVEQNFNEMWPEPPIRFKTVMGKGGTNRQEPILDDPSRDRELDKRAAAEAAYRFYLALSADDKVSFETEVTDKDSLIQLLDEVKNSGFTSGEITMVLKATIKVSSLDDDTWENIENFIA